MDIDAKKYFGNDSKIKKKKKLSRIVIKKLLIMFPILKTTQFEKISRSISTNLNQFLTLKNDFFAIIFVTPPMGGVQ